MCRLFKNKLLGAGSISGCFLISKIYYFYVKYAIVYKGMDIKGKNNE